MKKLITFDIHGTLVNDQYKINENLKKLLKEMDEEGHIISLASGAHYTQLGLYTSQLDFPVVAISNSGALVKDFKTNKVYETSIVENEVCKHIYNTFLKFPSLLMIHTKEKNVYSINNSTFEHMSKLPVKIKEEDMVSLEEAKELMFNERITQCSIKTYPDIHHEVSRAVRTMPRVIEHRNDDIMDIFVDIGPIGISKYSGIEKIQEIYNINSKNIYFFGDDTNDIVAIENVENSVAMGNGKDIVKEKARFVIGDNNSEAIYQFLKNIND